MTDAKPMFINGEWVLAEGGATFDVINPADQSTVASVANGAAPEIERAVQAAHAAFREWSLLAPKDRGRILLAIQELMEERRTSSPGSSRWRTASPTRRRRRRCSSRSATSA